MVGTLMCRNFNFPVFCQDATHKIIDSIRDTQTKISKQNEKTQHSKKSPTGPTERTPKPEYLIVLVTFLGVRWDSVPFNFWWKHGNPKPRIPSVTYPCLSSNSSGVILVVASARPKSITVASGLGSHWMNGSSLVVYRHGGWVMGPL